MKIKKNIASSDEGFLFNPTTGDSFSTNAIGIEILQLLKTECTSDEICNRICEKYDVDPNLFERDLEDFTLQLREFGILE